MPETRFAPGIEEMPEKPRAKRGGFNKLGQYASDEELKAEQERLKEDPESWRGQE